MNRLVPNGDSVRFGIFDHMEFRSGSLGQLYEERLDMLEQADAAGFWCYHKAEHHFNKLDAAPSANVFLAAASQRTQRLRFGSLVYLLPFYDPIRLIEEICTLDHLSGGRLEIGVGKGISPAEHKLWGNDPAAARDLFEEAFAILRKGLLDSTLNHEGPRRTFQDAVLTLRPSQDPHPPIWYPGNIDYAGRHRLNTITAGPTPMVAQAVATYKNLLATPEANWNPGVAEPTIGVTRHLYVAESDEQAIKRVRQAYSVYHQNLAHLFKKYNVAFAPPGDPSFNGDVDAALAMEGLIAGSPESIKRHIQKVRDEAGIDYFVGAFAWGDLTHTEVTQSMALYANEVMPAFANKENP
jgi:alkanesulfonate monooxygenase SsuD/methylene tetrahydromethanopterin reductase-like flavin-dependent oxidoreductase (luciferase family)